MARQGRPARAGDPGRGRAARPHRARHPAADRRRVRRHPAPFDQPDRDGPDPARHRARDDPPGDGARPDGDRRGDADLHLPEPLRLSDRRGRRQQGLPARTSATTSSAGAGCRANSSSWCARPSRRCRCWRCRTSTRRSWALEMLHGSARSSFGATHDGRRSAPAPDPAAILHDTITQASRERRRQRHAAADDPVREEGGDRAQAGRPRAGRDRRPQRRTIMLPPTLAAYKPVSATYVDGILEVAFSRGE